MVITPLAIAQRDIWLADLDEPVGSAPGYRRPVIVVQADAINLSRLATYLCIPLTSRPFRLQLPWNLNLSAAATGLEKDSVAQTNLLTPVDQSQMIERIGHISEKQLKQLFACLDIALGRN
jgi:mRNA interferase MazF